jgi:hypothetical protein
MAWPMQDAFLIGNLLPEGTEFVNVRFLQFDGRRTIGELEAAATSGLRLTASLAGQSVV